MFLHTFGQPEHAAPLLRRLLPSAIAAAIDWSTLRRLPGSQIDKRLRRRFSDLLFEVQLRGRPVLLYVLFEHKSRNDRWVAVQMLGYVVGIWRQLLQQRPRPDRLPPILPLVVHHGREGWTAPMELTELIDFRDLDAATAAAVRSLQPSFRYLLDSYSGRSEEELRKLALTALGKLTLAMLQFVARRNAVDAAAAFVRWADIALEVLAAPSGQEAIAALSSYVLQTTPIDPDTFGDLIERHLDHRTADIMRSTAARLRKEGRAEGRTEGRTEGRAELLLRQLAARFGPLPAACEATVRAAAIEQLDRWALRVLDAPSLDAVFAD